MNIKKLTTWYFKSTKHKMFWNKILRSLYKKKIVIFAILLKWRKEKNKHQYYHPQNITYIMGLPAVQLNFAKILIREILDANILKKISNLTTIVILTTT